MNTNIINSIENLKYYSDDILREIQRSKIPTEYKLDVERRYSYEPHGFYRSQYKENALLFLVSNLPYIANVRNDEINDKLDILISQDILNPFLLFIDKKFVKWSDITIISDCKVSYIMIDNIPNSSNPQADCVILPSYISYNESSTVSDINTDTIFIFNSNGIYIHQDNLSVSETYTTINTIYDNSIVKEEFYLVDNKRQKTSLDAKYKINKENIILFQDGYLYNTGELDFHGLNVFSVDNNIFSYPIVCKIFLYTNTNESKDILTNIKDKSYLINKMINNTTLDNYIVNANIPFQFSFDKNISYEENIVNALGYIMKYNSSYLDEVYKAKSNVESRVYTGTYINSIKDENGWVKMSKKIGSSVDNMVMILVNGELYKNYHTLYYKGKDFIFYCDILDTDSVEILYFKNIDNRVYKQVLDSNGDNTFYINPLFDIEHMTVFSPDLETSTYNISRSNNVEFEVESSIEKINDTTVKVTPKSKLYYDRKISLLSKRQFRYTYKLIKEETNYLKLSDEYIYGNNPLNYLVYINGRRLNKENFKITVPTNTRPFDDITVFINIVLKPNDRFEIFYIGEDFEELILQPAVVITGNIILDKTKLGYGFNKDLYLFFINGKKIKPEDIINIDQNRVRINNNQNTVKNLCILKYIKEESVLSDIFINNKDLITQILDSTGSSEISKLYTNDRSLSNIEIGINSNAVSMKSVLYQIITKYWMRPAIADEDPFIYDFEDPQLLDLDTNGNLLFPINI